MKQLLLILLIFSSASSYAQSIEDTIKAQRFVDLLFARYPSDYHELGSEVQWSEVSSHFGENGSMIPYHFTSSLLKIDTNAQGVFKYVKEITPIELKSFGLKFYEGREAAHYELSLDGFQFLAFMSDSTADFINASPKYDSVFISDLQGIQLPDQQAKEEFCYGLTNVFHYHKKTGDCKPKVTYTWNADTLTIIKVYQQACLYQKQSGRSYYYYHYEMDFYFDKDRLKGYWWMQK